MRKETKKAVDFESWREERRQTFVEAAKITGAWFALSSNRPLTGIADARTKKQAYSEMSEEQAQELPPWNQVMAVGKSR